MIFLAVTIFTCVTFLVLTLFFTLKSVSKESILTSIFSNKFAFLIIYGLFTFFMILGLALTYSIYDNIFPVWMMIVSLILLFVIMLIVAIYFALKISRSSNLKIYQAPGSQSNDIPTTIVLEDIMQVEGGVEGEILENVRFFPGGRVVRSFDYGGYGLNGRDRPRRIFIDTNKIHYNRDNIHYLKGNFVTSRDPRYDVEISMMGFDTTKEMYDLAEKLDYFRGKYYSIRDQVKDLADAFRNMGSNQKVMSEAMGEGAKQLLEKTNIQFRGKTDWERKGELERVGLSKKELKKFEEASRQLDELKRKGSE